MRYSDLFKDADYQRALKTIAEEEGVELDFLKTEIERGRIVVPQNRCHRNIKPVAIGKGLRTKVNANIGTSPDYVDIDMELEKLRISIEAGADTVMDLSTGGDLREIRQEILRNSTVPVGSVPIYEAAVKMARKRRWITDMTAEDIFEAIRAHIEDGIDFITVHCGVTLRSLQTLERGNRVTGVVSRGGSFLVRWMRHNRKENPLYENYDRLLEMARDYNVTLSLGDGLRPGCLADATDRPQMEELLILGELVDRARDYGVQVMVEGPGHIPLHEIWTNVQLEKKVCKEAPFYVLGPLVVDCAPGYDHITSAIGGAVAAWAGADFLCYVTPTEHLGLPDVEDVREGVIAARIAAHAGDIAKGVKGARDLDDVISRARKAFDWERQISLSIDPRRARQIRERWKEMEKDSRKCTMCGEFCAMREVGV